MLGSIMAAICLALLFLALGCSATEAPSPNIIQKMSGEQPPPIKTSGFLGDYSQLKPGREGQTALVYINPNVQWSKYNKVIVDPVQFWANADTKVSKEDQQALCTYFHNIVEEDLRKGGFTIVDQPGPDVMRLELALTDANAATPGLRSVSVIVPQARVLNMVQSMATGSYAFVGGAQAEGQIIDSVTGERLAASVDKRVGGASLSAAAQWKWGDAENVMKYWAEKITARLEQLKSQNTAG
ncbi:MAG: DUF3313 domain-containing protein [Candidatus Binataceae bacterium]